MDRRTVTLSLGALLVAGGGAIYLNQTNGALPGVNPALAQTSDDVVLAPDIPMGDPNAPVTIVEYASYTCPHCANFHEEVLSQLKTEYVETGKVQFIHREVYFDRLSLWAGMIARCGGELRYHGMNDLIYGGQRDWIGTGEPQEVLENLKKLGRMAGMNDDQMTACLEDRSMAEGMVAAWQQNGTEDEINATPTMVIDGEKYQNMSYAELKAIVDEKLGQ